MWDGPMPRPTRNPNVRLKIFSTVVGSRKTGRVWGMCVIIVRGHAKRIAQVLRFAQDDRRVAWVLRFAQDDKVAESWAAPVRRASRSATTQSSYSSGDPWAGGH